MVDFAGKFGLRAALRRGRSRGYHSAGGSSGPTMTEDLGYQPLAESEKDSRYGPVGSKSRAYYDKLQSADVEKSRKFSTAFAKEQQKASENKFDREKEFVGKWTDLVLKAREVGDTALQKHLLSYGRDYIDTLSYGTRQLLEPLLRAGPFDPAKAKLEKYDSLNPAPQITADKETQPLLHAEQLFQVEDWRAARTHYATNQVGPKRNLLPYDADKKLHALRDQNGRVSVVNEESMQVKEFAKQFSVTEGEVFQNGGAPGKEQTVMINGKITKTRPFTSFPDRETTLQTLPGMTPEQFQKHEKELAEFLAVLNSGDEKLIGKNPMAKLVFEQEKSDNTFDTVAPLLKQAYGYNFVKPTKKAGILSELWDFIPGTGNYVKGSDMSMSGGYVEGDTSTIKFFPGELTKIRVSDGTERAVYYDSPSDMIYTTEGTRLGKREDAMFKINSQLEKQKQQEEEKKKKYKGKYGALENFLNPISTYGEPEI